MLGPMRRHLFDNAIYAKYEWCAGMPEPPQHGDGEQDVVWPTMEPDVGPWIKPHQILQLEKAME